MQNDDDNFVRDNMYEGSKSAIYAKPILYTILSLTLTGMSINSFFKIRNMEADGYVKLPGITQDLYQLGGKWLVIGSTLLAAGIVGYRGLNFWKGIKEGLKK